MDVTKILTEKQFYSSPFKGIMSYSDYVSNALKYGSAFTLAKAMTLQKAKDTSDNIKSSVNGWYIQKEENKAEAEEKYYAALEQYEAMQSAQTKALNKLQYATNMFGQDSSQYTDAVKKYNLSSKTLFGADINLGIARDQFNFANASAFKAYLTTQLS